MQTESILLVNTLLNIVLRSLSTIEKVSGKTREEILDLLKDEKAKTEELLGKLK